MSRSPTSPGGSLASCEDLLARYLEEHHEGRGDFAAFCARFPAEADGLRALHARLQAIGELDLATAPTVVDPPALHERIEEFELVGELGRGGMGIVYEARDRSLARSVAVKVLPAARVRLGDARARFEREIAALSRLSHPHLVPIYRSGLAHEPPFLAMELVRGGVSLEKRLEALRGVPLAARKREHLLGELPAKPASRSVLEATTDVGAVRAPSTSIASDTRAKSEGDATYCGVLARLLAETAEALEHAHQNGVLHRDVKPANLLIDERGAARLVDFGVARLADEVALTATGGFAGTPLYAAPEQISSEHGELDGRADVYALGVVLYQGLTGAGPYSLREGADSREIFERIAREIPIPATQRTAGVPWELAVIAAKALEKRPERRYPSAAAFAADLRAWIAHRPIVARAPGLWRRAMQSARRNPWIAVPLAAGAAAIAVAAIVWLARDVASWRAHVARAREIVASAAASRSDLRKTFEALAVPNRRFAALEFDAYMRPLEEAERRERAVCFAEKERMRKQALQLLDQRTKEFHQYKDAMSEADRALVLDAFLSPGLDFAREAGSKQLERDLLQLAADHGEVPQLRILRQSFALEVATPGARVHLFRYVEERELAPQTWLGPRCYPVPCDREGRAAFPSSAAWEPGRTYPIDPSDPSAGETLYPLFATAENTFRAGDLPAELPVASYLLWIRAEGCVDVRVPLYLDARMKGHRPALAIALDPVGDVPQGFVRVEGGGFLSGGDRGRSLQSEQLEWTEIEAVYVARTELSFGAYLDVLRWKQERGASMARHLPRDHRGEFPPAPWSIDLQTLRIEPPELADLPVCSIRYDDALAWCAYATERAQEAGSPWIYELPSALTWEKAARGADGRVYAWGDEFDWSLCYGLRSEHGRDGFAPAPTMPERSARCLGDESPYGILALTGNVEELVYRSGGDPSQRGPGIKGGGFLRPDPMSYRLPRTATTMPEPSRGTGFRPALRRRDMPAQGRRAKSPLLLTFEPSHE